MLIRSCQSNSDAAFDPGYRAFEARLRRELHALSASLKKSVPFHSPRYIGHMVSDLLILMAYARSSAEAT